MGERTFEMAPNTWSLISVDADGARRHSSFRYVEDGRYFLLWGYLSYNVYIYGGPHIPRTDNPEYDIVVFDPDAGRWTRLDPGVETPDGRPPACRREAVYIPGEDALFTCGAPADDEENAGVYVYRVGEDVWRRIEIPAPPDREMWEVAGQNRAMAYDPGHDLVLMVLGAESRSDLGAAVVYALKYRDFSSGPRTA